MRRNKLCAHNRHSGFWNERISVIIFNQDEDEDKQQQQQTTDEALQTKIVSIPSI